MTVRIAINGFGRIGRNVIRALYESGFRKKIVVVAINELADSTSMAHLLKYDTSHGRFSLDVHQEKDQLYVGSDLIHLLHIRKIEDLPWRKFNIEVVLDCTGVYGSHKHGEAHLMAGAKKVLFSHLGSHDLDAIIVYGVNHNTLQARHRIVSNASCTTNCIIPIIKLLDDAYDIESGTAMTIHSAMNDQNVIDTYHPDLRRTRAASQSIIPVDSNLADGISRIFPKFSDRFQATSVRVPTINVIAIDLNVMVTKPAKTHEVNLLLEKAAKEMFHGIVEYTELPLVSIDFTHNPHSAIVDGKQTRVSGRHLIKMLVWCDNEWGFANRMLDTTLAMVHKVCQ